MTVLVRKTGVNDVAVVDGVVTVVAGDFSEFSRVFPDPRGSSRPNLNLAVALLWLLLLLVPKRVLRGRERLLLPGE